ncbi:helix-hairpin-helix domain-containing protein [Halanaerobium praevalens]|uniref:Competence protein ComEA helix-hairpin-helix repeat protein n=1 Tax=Halanaerobium praevalens (strain ATCC 33744 / DSM 2228 / GSL) TaxID=572479 RepID=E3DQ41_HALPG|nr:helix-hairpin-helix domain-containing protein [Halanaerobium praevalens]ADO76792.1 competence protein ComEA helix-hairpin-helix repeat protein [Halanaerobium praevalens DSM 2228]
MKNKSKTIIIVVVIMALVFIAYSQKNLKNESDFKSLNDLSLKESSIASKSNNKKATKVIVHLSGAVKNPGVYKLTESDRLIDLIKAAGGLTTKADLDQINLAEKLFDGQKLKIPSLLKLKETSNLKAKNKVINQNYSSKNTDSKYLNINRASQAELESLSGIGPAKAATIIKYRSDNGPFAQKKDLLKISGIGPKTLANIEDEIVLR